MKKIELEFKNLPTNIPVTITINVAMDNFSKVKIFKTKENGKPTIVAGKNKNHCKMVYFKIRDFKATD